MRPLNFPLLVVKCVQTFQSTPRLCRSPAHHHPLYWRCRSADHQYRNSG
ncbi:Uncharacterised protein [Vibrio cholerae]|nr:Uncharacterised protein [Vibrio cholerae]CSI14877.1 Uncharacterised protein [Vibrio cholerae]